MRYVGPVLKPSSLRGAAACTSTGACSASVASTATTDTNVAEMVDTAAVVAVDVGGPDDDAECSTVALLLGDAADGTGI